MLPEFPHPHEGIKLENLLGHGEVKGHNEELSPLGGARGFLPRLQRFVAGLSVTSRSAKGRRLGRILLSVMVVTPFHTRLARVCGQATHSFWLRSFFSPFSTNRDRGYYGGGTARSGGTVCRGGIENQRTDER